MTTKIEAARVDTTQLGFVSDGDGSRLVFPHAEAHAIDGRSGSVAFGATELAFEELEGHLSSLLWHAAAGSVGSVWLKDDAGRVDVKAERLELPRGVRLVRAEKGVEIVAHHVTFADLALTVTGPFRSSAPAVADPAAPAKPPLAERLRFLDSLSGKIAVTVKVALDLPVLGTRTLDQKLEVAIKEGSLDFRALEDSLNWLEGQVLDIRHDGAKLAVTWRVPVVGRHHDLIAWTLDHDASALAAFGRVPVRALADFRVGEAKDEDDDKPDKKHRNILESFAIDAIDVVLSLLAPRNLEIGGGTILFGGDDSPGLVDLG